MLATEAEIIYAASRGGMTLSMIEDMELWEIAAACGLHRIETRAEHDTREITEAKADYWEETKATRQAKMAGYSERRRERERERKRLKASGNI